MNVAGKNQFSGSTVLFKCKHYTLIKNSKAIIKLFVLLILPITATGVLLLIGYGKYRLHKFKSNNKVLEKHIAERTRQMESTVEELNHSRQALLERNLVQQRLLTAISHDIKSPLKFLEMVSRQYLEKLKVGEGDRATSIRVTSILQEGSYRLYLLTDNLLQYLKLYANDGAITIEKVHLRSLVEEKCILFKDIAESGANQILNKVPDDLCVEGDITLLRVILHNLFDNATKVTQEGLIEIEALVIENQVSLRVSDTGPGMMESLVDWCNNKEVESGRVMTGGMGLIIVKELVNLINSTIRVSSQPSKGTVIELTLPSVPCS